MLWTLNVITTDHKDSSVQASDDHDTTCNNVTSLLWRTTIFLTLWKHKSTNEDDKIDLLLSGRMVWTRNNRRRQWCQQAWPWTRGSQWLNRDFQQAWTCRGSMWLSPDLQQACPWPSPWHSLWLRGCLAVCTRPRPVTSPTSTCSRSWSTSPPWGCRLHPTTSWTPAATSFPCQPPTPCSSLKCTPGCTTPTRDRGITCRVDFLPQVWFQLTTHSIFSSRSQPKHRPQSRTFVSRGCWSTDSLPQFTSETGPATFTVCPTSCGGSCRKPMAGFQSQTSELKRKMENSTSMPHHAMRGTTLSKVDTVLQKDAWSASMRSEEIQGEQAKRED